MAADESGIELDFDLNDPNMIDLDLLLDDVSGDDSSFNFYKILSQPAPVQSASFKTESATSRTQIKQQLMKDQLLKENERKQQQIQKATSSQQQPRKMSVNIQNVNLPQHVLQVRTGLQNPTKYHIMEKQKNQVLEYISSSQKTGSGFRTKAYSAPVGQQSPSSYAAPSPSVQSYTSGGTSDAEEVMNDILSFEEGSQRSRYGSNASLESGQSRVKAESDDRAKKETHNMIERRRRYNINDRIKELGDLLPQRNEEHYDIVRDSRANKGTILKSSVDYIKVLKNDVNKLKQIETDNRSLKMENRKLLLRIQQLEIEAREKGIELQERTWKPVQAEAIIEQVVRGRSRPQMPDVVTEAACVYDETMDDVQLPDPMLSAAAVALPNFTQMDTE